MTSKTKWGGEYLFRICLNQITTSSNLVDGIVSNMCELHGKLQIKPKYIHKTKKEILSYISIL